jgi:integrase
MGDLITVEQGGWDRLLKDVPAIYRKGAQDFVGFLRAGGYQFGDPAGLKAYEKHLNRIHPEGRMKGRRYSASTFNSYVDAARDRLRWALAHSPDLTVGERYQLEEALKMKRRKRPPAAVATDKVLTEEEIERFLERCPDQTVSLIFEFLYKTACRVSEALGILIHEIKDAGDHAELYVRGKGSKDRWVMISSELAGRIRAHFQGATYLFEHHGRPYRREYVSMRIKRLGRKILGRDISAHTLRHSRATERLVKTGRIKAVQDMLGHANSSTTINLYVHDKFSWADLCA